MSADYTPTSHKAINQVHRLKDRAKYDAETIHSILDNNLLAHVGFTLPPGASDEDDWPFVMPMCYGRIDDIIYLHGYREKLDLLSFLLENKISELSNLTFFFFFFFIVIILDVDMSVDA